MDTGLKNKVVLITGATRNHGKATALAFAAEGANLLICTRKSMDLLEDTARLAADRGIKVLAKQCDVTVEAQVNDLVQSGLAEFGRIDVLVNNAGQRVHGDIMKLNMEEWRAGLDVNVHALFLTCKAVLPGMLKMATLGFTRAIAQEYGEFNITANCIAPWAITVERNAGHVSSGITAVRVEGQAIPRRGTIAECAALAVFLASDKAGYITGQNYSVNGGAYFS